MIAQPFGVDDPMAADCLAGLPSHILDKMAASDIQLIRFIWVDHNGISRGKAVSRRYLSERIVSGIGLAKCRQAANAFDRIVPFEGYGAVGEVRMIPDPDTFITLPHAPGSAAMLCDLVDLGGQAWEACPRQFLKDAISAAREMGFDPVAAFEPEFTLFRSQPTANGAELFDDSLCFDNVGFDIANDFTIGLTRALIQQGVDVEIYHPEFGAGQHELTCRHADALKAADTYVWQRAITRGMAMRDGHWASFAPIPQKGFRGNGNHVHLSLWRDGVNAFHDPHDQYGLSQLGYHFIGGLLAHAPALTALTCPSVNSYRRLQPGMWSGAFASYGPDNREAAVRIPSALRGRAAASTNIEFKPCDSTANPYIALGALLFAGLDGIRNGMDPGAALTQDPNRLTGAELRMQGIHTLPSKFEEALEMLDHSAFFRSVLGPLRHLLYLSIKKSDVREFRSLDESKEFLHYSTRY
ncbi:glutamine synthetase [Duganella sp. FT92W]|uniref:Glutamine synthetase n=1 Tax=Pseudoduganella rivuli TaxID=2666085 RepID=A0A7X2LTW3_9BURK|nr:glutamine synthetase family protein [Pseudoduganella rivuli]MRV72392.1 glutamine synthetase [Pseudoduganella rivuli]